jgi:hypothetical protein
MPNSSDVDRPGDATCPACGGSLAMVVADGSPTLALCAHCGAEWEVEPGTLHAATPTLRPRHRVVDVATGDYL